MSNRYSSLIGNAMGLYGYPQGQVVFGGDVPMDPQTAALVAQQSGGLGGFPGYGYGNCGNPFGLPGYDAGLNAIMAKNSVAIGDTCGPNAVDYPLPVGNGETIDAFGTLTINATPQLLYTPWAFCVPSTIASSLVIEDITIGTASCFAAIGPIPAMLFIETATYRGISWDTCLPNQPIQVQFRNIHDQSFQIYAAFLGKGVRGSSRIFGAYPRT